MTTLRLTLLASLLWVFAVGPASSQELPDRAPRPDAKPAETAAPEAPPEVPQEGPTPETKPPVDDVADPADGSPQSQPPDDDADDAKNEGAAGADSRDKVIDSEKPEEMELRPRPPQPTPAEEAACRVRLKALGVVFEDQTAESDELGCSMPAPVAVTRLGPAIEVAGSLVVNCATAEAAARFAQVEIAPRAVGELDSALVSVAQTSGYVCRPRNGTRTLSEHAFGNAVDFGAFTLADGRQILVETSEEPAVASFLQGVREAACGPFTTVLGPGSDADHANHFHLDLAQRRGGTPYCR